MFIYHKNQDWAKKSAIQDYDQLPNCTGLLESCFVEKLKSSLNPVKWVIFNTTRTQLLWFLISVDHVRLSAVKTKERRSDAVKFSTSPYKDHRAPTDGCLQKGADVMGRWRWNGVLPENLRVTQLKYQSTQPLLRPSAISLLHQDEGLLFCTWGGERGTYQSIFWP